VNRDLSSYAKQNINKEDIDEVISVLKSDFITQGPQVELFEKEICESTSANYAVTTNSATSALHIACMALDLKKGDFVWTSPITFVASANCAIYCGANIDFIDIDYKTGLISLEALKIKLERAQKENTLPKVIIPVHLGGVSCDMDSLFELSKTYGFSLIEDASHALGGKYKSNLVGSCARSSITVFSFHPVKIITTGEGGVACTNDREIAKKLYLLRSHGITKDKKEFLLQSTEDWQYEQQLLGYNYRMNEIQSALGRSQLKRLKSIVKKRNYLLKIYSELLRDTPFSLIEQPRDVYSAVHLAIIRIPQNLIKHYSNLFNGLRSIGIGTQLHYSPVHLQPFYRNLGFTDGDFIQSEKFAKSHFSLPLYPELEESDIKYIVKNLQDISSDLENQ